MKYFGTGDLVTSPSQLFHTCPPHPRQGLRTSGRACSHPRDCFVCLHPRDCSVFLPQSKIVTMESGQLGRFDAATTNNVTGKCANCVTMSLVGVQTFSKCYFWVCKLSPNVTVKCENYVTMSLFGVQNM